MLIDLIHLLLKNDLYLDNTLADKLGGNEKMVRQMLCELARLGYVENIFSSRGSSHCSTCNFHCSSRRFSEKHAWMLTEQGIKAAQTLETMPLIHLIGNEIPHD